MFPHDHIQIVYPYLAYDKNDSVSFSGYYTQGTLIGD